MRKDSEAWVDEALQTLAGDDAQVKAPDRLHAAVMGEWDRQQTRPRRSAMRARGGRAFVWAAVSVAAAATLVLVVLRQEPVDPSSPGGTPVETMASPVSPVDNVPEAPVLPGAAEVPLPRPVAAPEFRAPVAERGYVIVPGALVGPMARHLVRARMSSRALATLGMPMVNADADGLVEVEMLVGDDGVAQMIRRAAFVSDQSETGGEQ
jgi:hypothetical protein